MQSHEIKNKESLQKYKDIYYYSHSGIHIENSNITTRVSTPLCNITTICMFLCTEYLLPWIFKYVIGIDTTKYLLLGIKFLHFKVTGITASQRANSEQHFLRMERRNFLKQEVTSGRTRLRHSLIQTGCGGFMWGPAAMTNHKNGSEVKDVGRLYSYLNLCGHLPSLNPHSEEQRCKSVSQTANISLLDLGEYDDLWSILRKNRATQEHKHRHSVEWKRWCLPFRGLNLSHILHVHRFHLFI